MPTKKTDLELLQLKKLLEEGRLAGRTSDSFWLVRPVSNLYTLIVKGGDESIDAASFKTRCLALVDNNSFRVNTNYPIEAHKQEITNFAEKAGRLAFDFTIEEKDFKAMWKSVRFITTPPWKVKGMNKAVQSIERTISFYDYATFDVAQRIDRIPF